MTDTDIKALVERLRDQAESYDDRAGMLEREAADALEALQAERDGIRLDLNDCNSERVIWKARAEKAEAEIAKATGYAERLATVLWEKHWRDDVPQWKPFTGDLIGILTQIDNAVSVLVRAEKAEAALAELDAAS